MSTYQYSGKVIDRSTRAPLAYAVIHALDAAHAVHDVVAAAQANERGEFTIEVRDSQIKALFGDHEPVLYFLVLAEGVEVGSTERTVQWLALQSASGRLELAAANRAGAAPAARAVRYGVEGTVCNADGVGRGSVTVEARYRVLLPGSGGVITEELIGSTTTDPNGQYRISYDPSSFEVWSGRHAPDLVLKASDGSGELGTATVCNAPPRAFADIVIGGTENQQRPSPTHFNRVSSGVLRFVNGEAHSSSAIAAFTDDVVDYHACRTGFDPSEVRALRGAARLNVAHPSVPMEAFYALTHRGFSEKPEEVFSHRLPVLRDAIQAAVAERAVSPDVTADLGGLMSALQDEAVSALRSWAASDDDTKLSLATVVDDCPGLSSGEKDAFLSRVLNSTEPSDAFWTALAGDGSYSTMAKTRLRFASEAAPVTGFFRPVLQALYSRVAGSTLSDDPAALAQYDEADWLSLIQSLPGTNKVPADTTGTTDLEKRQSYAAALARNVEKRFRTPVIRDRVKRAEPGSTLDVFFDHNDAFDFASHRVDRYLAENATALGAVAPAERDALVDRLKKTERLFRITDRWSETKALYDAGLHSASAVHQLGFAQVSALLTTSMSPEAISNVFDRACWATSGATAMKAKYSASLSHTSMAALPNVGVSSLTLPPKLADWTKLFGSEDGCSCEHCRSVLGPAAYLTDTLQQLKRLPRTPSGTARQALFERRPDLPRLALSCNNATTALPYADVVIEVMEVRAATASFPATPARIDTSLETAELVAQPEVLFPNEQIAAYTALYEEANWPFSLPFHFFQEEARVYLAHLGVPRRDLLTVLAPAAAGPNQRHLAIERLETNGRQYDIIAGPPAPSPPNPSGLDYWNIDPANLGQARIFLEKSGLTFDELRELTRTTTVGFASDATCDLDSMHLTGLTTETAQQLVHRFLRLRKVLGWSIHDTDKGIQAFGGTLNEAALQKLAGIRELERRFSRPAVELLAWFANIDRKNTWAPSLFERVFLDKRVQAVDEGVFSQVFATGSTTAALSTVAPGLLAALAISASDLSLLIGDGGNALALPAIYVGETETASLAQLSRLYRIVSFARAAGLSIRDWMLIRALTGASAIAGDGGTAGPDDALAFPRLLDRVRTSPVSLPEAHFVLRHVVDPESDLPLTMDRLTSLRRDLEEAVAKAASEAALLRDDDTSNLVAPLRDTLLDEADVEDTRKLTDDPAAMTTRTPAELINTVLAPYLGGTAAVSDALAKLATGGGSLTTMADRRTYLAQRLKRYGDCQSLVTSWVAQTFGIESDVAARLLQDKRPSGPRVSILKHGSGPAVRAFIPGDEWTAPRGSQPEREELIVRIQKACLVLKRCALTALELEALYPNGWSETAPSGLPAIDFNLVPVAKVATEPVPTDVQSRMQLLLRLGDLVNLRDRWPSGSEGLLSVFALAKTTATLQEVLDRLGETSGWNRADLGVLSIAGVLGLEDVERYQDERALLALEKANAVLKRLGVPAATAVDWLEVESAMPGSFSDGGPNALTIARDIRRAARAKYQTDEAWSAVARPLRNALRVKQRDALVAYLLDKLSLKDANALYEHLLIDVEMDPCMMTSRLVLAHGTVQHFVQRILLNLEAGLAPTTSFAGEWRWMKSYRVWEANRKVFLWPENWIEPELRDDKTPLFEELERALLSGPLDNNIVEDAYRSYLDGLADIANLDIVAMHDEVTDGETFLPGETGRVITHVFGRVLNSNRYYHRKRVHGSWTPWQKIDLDIQGDHLVPFTFGGRLYLAWGLFEDVEKKVPSAAGPLGDPSLSSATSIKSHQPTKIETTARMSVSEHRMGIWTQPTQSDAVRLGASPFKPWLSFITEVSGSIVTSTLLLYTGWGDQIGKRLYKLAQFEYEPGTTRHAAKLLDGAELQDDAPSKLWQADTLTGPIVGGGAGSVEVTRPTAHIPTGQHFDHTEAYGLEGLTLKLELPGNTLEAAPILGATATVRHKVVVERGPEPAGERSRLIIQDKKRAFFAELHTFKPLSGAFSLYGDSSIAQPLDVQKRYRFQAFSHPLVNKLRNLVALRGIEGLLRPADQAESVQYKVKPLIDTYDPDFDHVEQKFPEDRVDFTPGSAYGVYNWEIFFHAPFLIATRLTAEGRYEEAMRWFHTIFDPTDGNAIGSASSYWKMKPLADITDLATMQEQLETLADNAYASHMLSWANGETDTAAAGELSAEIAAWREHPFDPHLLARMRPIAYQKAVVMRYLDNILAWADSLFARDSMESINEALQLYVLAQNLLGRRPITVQDPHPTAVRSYAELTDPPNVLDAFSNAVVDTEVLVPKALPGVTLRCPPGPPPPTIAWGSLYFCVPQNEKLVGYWDLVADRLFKIRHCQNIEGVTRTIPLFEPPIDPALLVRAAAAGLDLSSVLFDTGAPLTPYRYGVLYGKAVELASSVASLGAIVLSALEKLDGEALAMVRQGHEIATQEAIRDARRSQLKEAEQGLEATRKSLASAQERFDFYSTREKVNAAEATALGLTSAGQLLGAAASLTHTGGAAAAVIPEVTIGLSGWAASPVTVAMTGGHNAHSASISAAEALTALGGALTTAGNIVGTVAGWDRRKDDWDLQAKLAQREIAQIEAQIVAAEIRVESAKNELRTVERQISQAREVETFLRRKFTNQELYGWMKDQLASVYYQAYKLAFEAAKRAERALHFELGDNPQSFITFGYWDGLKKGLLAGERLLQALRAMDAAYTAQNARELEITKQFSLAKWAPDALMALRKDAKAWFSIEEAIYDLDYPSHYFRRIKSIAATVHCTPGPYQEITGTLTQLAGSIQPASGAAVPGPAPVQVAAISQPNQDAGVFELSFSDPRYLPFEGAGAHYDGPAQFELSMSLGSEIDPVSITDVVLAIRYTARLGAPTDAVPHPLRYELINVMDEHANEWTAYLTGSASEIDLVLPKSAFIKGRKQRVDKITGARVYIRYREATSGAVVLEKPNGDPCTAEGTPSFPAGEQTVVSFPGGGSPEPVLWTFPGSAATWKLTVPNPERVDVLWISFAYATEAL